MPKQFFRQICLLLVLLGCLALAGCTAADDTPQAVIFMITGDVEELHAYESLVARFAEERPGIPVEILHIANSGEFRERLATMYSAGQPPDVFIYNYRRLGNFAEDGAIHPLGDLLDNSDILDRSDFYPVVLDAFTYQGALQCLPQNFSSPVIYYNQSHFNAAGLPYPQAGWTLAEFVETARALTADTDGDGATDQWGFGSEVETIRLAPFIWQRGGDFFDNAARPARLTISDPAAKEAVQWFVDLQMVEHAAPDLDAETTADSETRFMQGTVSMFMNSRAVVPLLRNITAFTWDAAPLPHDGTPASVLHSDGFCMSSKAAADEAHAAAVWAFIEFSLSETGQTLLAASGRTVPSMIRVAESAAFLQTAPPANNRVWLDAAAYIRALPMLPEWNDFEGLFSTELQRAFYGNISVDELISNADELAAPLLNP
jgi:multiple sugar transport system substrate-binding protein